MTVDHYQSSLPIFLLFAASYVVLLSHLRGVQGEFFTKLDSVKVVLNQQNEIIQESLARSADMPVCRMEGSNSNVATIDKKDPLIQNPFSGYINHVVESYRDVLRETIIGQTESWNYISEYEGVDEVEMGSCPRLSPKVRSAPPTLPEESLEEFEWDNEGDIPGYLEGLLTSCSKNAYFDPNFNENCWDFLEDLIYEPRCTTRFDSRVSCRKDEVPDTTNMSSDIESILDGHFSMDTLNVVIVGSGPTGLFLANALAHANNVEKTAWHPDIRVTIIENRAEAQGVKEGFIRNWQTIPFVDGLASVIDPRIGKFFSKISNKSYFALPLNAIETLLHLSSRDLGVKFLYGNLSEYTDFLARQPNLLVFDATGHRLDGLIRGDNCPTSDSTPGILSSTMDAEEVISTWTPDEVAQDWYYMAEADYTMLNEYDSVVRVAQKGDLLYPVQKDGTPYATWWLHVHEIQYDQSEYDMEYFWGHWSSNSELCQACASMDSDLISSDQGMSTCAKFCSPNNFFDSGKSYRTDIAKRIRKDESSVWFATRGANIALSGEQAKRLMDVIKYLGYDKDPVGMPMSLLPLDAMAQDPIFKDTLLLRGLVDLAEVDGDKEPPVISVFQHRPYIYKNGEMKGDLFGSSTPVLRIGDSLATGDPNRSSGFVNHVWMLRRLVCRIRGQEKECSQDY